MKSLEIQLAELKEVIIPLEVKAGFSEQAALTGWSDAMKGKPVEQQLSIAKEKAKKHGVTESGKKINRNNGGSHQISEVATTDLKETVTSFKRSYGVSTAEALLSLHLERAMQPSWALSYATEKEFREAWTPFSDILTPTEIDGLVRNRVNAPKKK